DRRIKADSHIESENMHISTAHLVGRLKTTAIQHKSLNLGHHFVFGLPRATSSHLYSTRSFLHFRRHPVR
ncbi:MAG: hypothetical protein UMU76_09470, partial [Prosthecochloris sp.]|nr:hypothetical protein [Prosthecochloris sp.]